MTEKLSGRLAYALVLSIILLTTGFVAVGVRAFASALISDSIYLGVFGVLLLILSIYLILRRPPAATDMDRKICKLLLVRSGRIPLHAASGRHDRRRPLTEGRVRTAVAHERRSKQLPGFRVVYLEPVAAETARD
jgi:hypothetical protein